MFQTSRPVVSESFHDRDALLARLGAALDLLEAGSPKWIALIGPRRVGKTSLLLELARRAEHRPLAFVVLDAMAATPISREAWRWLALSVLDALLAPETRASLRVLAARPPAFRGALNAAPTLAKLDEATRHFVLELAEAEVDEAFIDAALDLPERLAHALNRRVVLAIDEFQELAALGSRRGGDDPFPKMRSTWQRHSHVAYTISGSARTMLTELVSSKRSPFFLQFELLEVGPFAREDAVALLAKNGIPRATAEASIEAVGGHPFYVQLLGEELLQSEPIDDAALKDSVQSLVFSRSGRLGLHFANEHARVVGQSAHLAAILAALAEGPARPAEIARSVRAPRGDISRYLERLGDAVIRGHDGRYALEDALFGAWIRWRQPGGAVVPMSLVGDDAERAVAAHLAALGFDLVYQSRASRGAFDLLATRGPRQLGVQVKRTALPLRFKKTEWRRMEADAAKLGWRFALAAVDPAGTVLVLDPEAARSGREIRLDESAAIDNLAAWLDA